ncbi:MAG: ribonuclease HII [Dehalococcoidales bacterium]|nr:ribonuclease HII [Dehalococcoidales bacterium]
MPSFVEERRLAAQGYRYIAGIDEAGRGALAGPIVAAAVILPRQPRGRWVDQVRDSKLLSPDKRDYLFHYIQEAAVSVAVGVISHEIIDAQNIVKATRLAMKQAIDRLSPPADTLLIDYLRLPEIPLPQKGIVNGDRLCLSIACASIVAKVTRDRLMIKMDSDYPGYGLAQHKGYCTKKHLACLNRLGPARIHRTSFQPIKGMTGL